MSGRDAFSSGDGVEANVQVRHNSYNRDKDGRLSTRYDPDSHTSFGVPSFIASNYVCDRVLHWYEGNQHAPLNGVMSFSQADNILIRQPRPKVGIAFADNIECVPGKTIRQLVIAGLSTTAVRHTQWA